MHEFNFVTNIEICQVFKSQAPLLLVRYSHIPTMILALLMGFFVYIKNRNLVGKLFLAISIFFSIWIALDLTIWEYGYNSTITMFAWSLLGIFNALISISCLYFVYVFIDSGDVSFIKKIIFGILLLPMIVLVPTRFDLTAFDAINCNAVEWQFYSPYYYSLGVLVSVWILIIALIRYKKASKDFKGQILLITVGVEAFVLSFAAVGFFISYLVSIGLVRDFNLEQYALLGMPIFIGLIAYLIVRYKAFNIKLIAAQALVTALVILIGAELFFATSATNQILVLITLAISLGFGYILVKSVKLEVERKEELQEMSDKLASANDQLRKLDNAKSEFISIASHQLRTPLTAVKGFVSLLLEGSYGKMSAKQQDTLNKVYSSNERLIALVEDMLSLSRIESGRMEYKFEKVKMEEVLQEVYDTFVLKAKDSKLSFEYIKTESPLPEAMTDRNKIREIISNFVDNAIKYTPQGGVKFGATQSGNTIRVSVTDTGIGIPKEEMPYLFAKFSRGKDTARLNTGGTGLGLHVGKRMIESLHGKLGVESEGAGKGSTFFVEVPLEMEEMKK